MEAAQRQRYLQAMGVTAWVRRDLPAVVAEVEVAAAVAEAAPTADTPVEVVARPVPAVVARPAASPVAGDWERLAATVQGCSLCGLHKTRLHAVLGSGDPKAEWMVVGEAPGAEEDRQGEPFVGPAGQLLNAMLLAVGREREAVYTTNALKCRPPNNRPPQAAELAHCAPYLEAQVALVRPKLILALGVHAAHTLLGSTATLAELRGRVHTHVATATPVVVTYHPAHLLRQPADKRLSWSDLQLARSLLESPRG